MRISQARSQLHFEYSLNGSQLQSTSCHSYLGVEISSDLKWNNHISRISAKANRALGFVRRNLNSCSKRIKLLAYFTLIRPILEYGARVWDPYTHILIDKLESIQRRAVRFTMNDYSRYNSVTDMMSELGIEPLILRRKIARLTNFHKARGGGSLLSQFKSYCTRSNGSHTTLTLITILPFKPTKTFFWTHFYQ